MQIKLVVVALGFTIILEILILKYSSGPEKLPELSRIGSLGPWEFRIEDCQE